LFFIQFEKDLEFVKQYVALPEEIQTHALYFGGKEALEKAMMEALQMEALEKDIRSEVEFQACAENLTTDLFDISHVLREVVQEILLTYHKVQIAMSDTLKELGNNRAMKTLIHETKKDLEALVPKDFLTKYPLARLKHIPRYLEALHSRVQRAKLDPVKDWTKAEQASRFIDAAKKHSEKDAADISFDIQADIEEFRWMVEEFKVSLFAPELKTAFPISPKRLLNKLKIIKGKVEDR
jgi:ATP-dependent helicase HrpA